MNRDWLIRGRDGRLSVYLPSRDGVLCRAERWPGGPWDAPRRVGGELPLLPTLALGHGSDRYAHLVSWRPIKPGEAGLVHSTHFRPLLAALDWHQIGHPNKTGDSTGEPAVAVRPGTLRALATSPGNTTLLYTDDSGDLCAWRPGGKPVVLLPCAGPGPVAAVRCELDGHDCTLLAQRSTDGRVAFAAYPTEAEPAGAWWSRSGPQLPPDAEVSLTTDADGRVVAASLSPRTGQLLLTRRKDEPGLALEAWREV